MEVKVPPTSPVYLVQEVCMIGGCQATITWPNKLNADDLNDMKYWLEGVLRKCERRAEESPQ